MKHSIIEGERYYKLSTEWFLLRAHGLLLFLNVPVFLEVIHFIVEICASNSKLEIGKLSLKLMLM